MPWHLNLTLARCFAKQGVRHAKFNAARLLRRALKFYAAELYGLKFYVSKFYAVNLTPNREAQILK